MSNAGKGGIGGDCPTEGWGTKHLALRCRQRGILTTMLDFVCKFGDVYHGPGGAMIYYLGHKACKRARAFGHKLDQLRNTVLVFAESGICMTAYKRARPQSHWRRT